MTITTVALLDMKTRLYDILADAIVQDDGLALVDWLPGSAPFSDSAGPDAALPDVFVQEVADPRGTGLPAHLLQVRNGARVLLVSSSGTDAAIYQLRLDSSFMRDVALDELLAAIRFGVDGIGRDRPPDGRAH